jgi:putative PIN family toxin of toxin-antitoxin system
VRVLLDTNVVLDAMATRKPHDVDARKIIKLLTNEIEGYITANTLTDIHYVSRKSIGDTASREAIRNLFEVFEVIDLKATDCKTALDLRFSDYEDCVLLTCAKRVKIDYIITRDEDLLGYDAPIPVISPKSFLENFDPKTKDYRA